MTYKPEKAILYDGTPDSGSIQKPTMVKVGPRTWVCQQPACGIEFHSEVKARAHAATCTGRVMPSGRLTRSSGV